MSIPSILYAGDSDGWNEAEFVQNGISYASSSHTLTYELRGPSTLTLTGTPNGTGWDFIVTTVQSAALLPGLYAWTAAASAGSNRTTAGVGTLTVMPNLSAQSAGYDPRTTAQKALDDVRAALATVSANRLASYTIGDRSFTYANMSELLQLESLWAAIVVREGRADSINKGKGNPGRLYLRFR